MKSANIYQIQLGNSNYWYKHKLSARQLMCTHIYIYRNPCMLDNWKFRFTVTNLVWPFQQKFHRFYNLNKTTNIDRDCFVCYSGVFCCCLYLIFFKSYIKYSTGFHKTSGIVWIYLLKLSSQSNRSVSQNFWQWSE